MFYIVSHRALYKRKRGTKVITSKRKKRLEIKIQKSIVLINTLIFSILRLVEIEDFYGIFSKVYFRILNHNHNHDIVGS